MKEIMMVKSSITSDIYTVKFHDGSVKEYANAGKLPKYVLTWMTKHSVSNNSAGDTVWM